MYATFISFGLDTTSQVVLVLQFLAWLGNLQIPMWFWFVIVLRVSYITKGSDLIQTNVPFSRSYYLCDTGFISTTLLLWFPTYIHPILVRLFDSLGHLKLFGPSLESAYGGYINMCLLLALMYDLLFLFRVYRVHARIEVNRRG